MTEKTASSHSDCPTIAHGQSRTYSSPSHSAVRNSMLQDASDLHRDSQHHSLSSVIRPPDTSFQCGLLSWRPQCLRRAGNIQTFLAAVCFISCLQAAFSGYFSSQVTTLEKRFAIGSSIIGIMNSFFEVGYIISVIFVSYAGGRGHVPRWIATGLFSMSLGAFLWSLPHFIFKQPVVKNSSVVSTPICQLPVAERWPGDQNVVMSSPDVAPSGYGFLPVFLAAHLLVGAGSSPILTLAPPFIDDHVPATRAPPMIASQYAAAAMGPVFGFGLGALMLQYPAETHGSTAKHFSDPGWIGAWWAGFIVLGILVLIGALLLLLFPRKLHLLGMSALNKRKSWYSSYGPSSPLQPNGTTESTTKCTRSDSILSPSPQLVSTNEEEPKTTYPPHLATIAEAEEDVSLSPPVKRDCSRKKCGRLRTRLLRYPPSESIFFKTFVSIVRNHIYILVCLCICSEMFLIMGLSSFLPKYLETEYQISKSTTSAIAGGLIVPSGALGILVGGLILNYFKFRRRGAIRFVLIINLIIIGCISSFFFLGCDNPVFAGVTVEYPNYGTLNSSAQLNRLLVPSLTHSCNAQCSCDPNHWIPVCHIASGTSFVSACYAGCLSVQDNDKDVTTVFKNCACVEAFNSLASVTSTTPPLTTPTEHSVSIEQCPFPCSSLTLFIVVLTTCLFLTGVIQNPLLMVTMRSVNHSERSFALGLQFVIIRVLANVPSPMVFGRVIDGACLHWRYNCGRRGDCAFVDLLKLNRFVTSLGIVIKSSGIFIYLILLYMLRLNSKSGRQSADTVTSCDRPVEARQGSISIFHSIGSYQPHDIPMAYQVEHPDVSMDLSDPADTRFS